MKCIFITILLTVLAACQPAPPLPSIGRDVHPPSGMCAADTIRIDKNGRTRCIKRPRR